MTTVREHEIRFQLSGAVMQTGMAAVDATEGIIRGATVAKAGVQATGKFLMLDASGKVTRDAALMKKELPIFTDDKTLETLMQCVGAGGGQFKARSDHDDSLGARAGYANNFKRDGDRVTCDLHLNESYTDRAIVLEVAQETPQLIGLSIDFQPEFQIEKDRALMRVSELNAVDIVDSGAITHQGLFLKAGVDNANTVKASSTSKILNSSTMAKETEPSEMSVAMAALLAAVTGLSADVKGCMSKLSEKPADKKEPDGDEAMSAALKPMQEQLSALSAEVVTLKKERAALGLKAEPGKVAAGAGSAENDAASRAAAEKPKTYLELVAEKKSASKLKAGDAHTAVQRENPKAYELHLNAKGVAPVRMSA